MIEWRVELGFEDKREMRGVAIYATSKKISDSGMLIYCADGQSTKTIADGFFRLHPKSAICFVGVDCSSKLRNAEYIDGRNPELFASHEHFLHFLTAATIRQSRKMLCSQAIVLIRLLNLKTSRIHNCSVGRKCRGGGGRGGIGMA
jgi:hypothetical protein